nr:PREDICTED: eukaryotic translation initiation factor 3 subunit J [Latimeria chalumnae]|eukprot:XP_005999753.1 PREDICTED: eukaryotic translation initiation factor 3 subunit J [Latimeria chalumnae]
MADSDAWDTDNFEVEDSVKKTAAGDRWEGEDEEEDVKDNWDDDEEEEKKKVEEKKPEEILQKKYQKDKKGKKKEIKAETEKGRTRLEEQEQPEELTAAEQLTEKLRLKKLEEESDLELAKETFGANNVTGLDAINPSSREEFIEFGKLIKEKISQYEKSIHYVTFLETLVRDLCISLEGDDLKKISNSLTVLCSEKQKQEKQAKAKKKKRGSMPGGGLKANMRDDLVDYGEFDGGYAEDFEDFM